MYEHAIHLYEKLPLCETGLAMGVALVLLHLVALLCPELTKRLLLTAHKAPLAGAVMLGIDFLWVALLLWDSAANPLRMPLFEFEGARGILLLLCPVIWFILSSMVKENLFPRALGMFLLLMAIVPLSAAFLKEPVTRLLIPIWWYPVLTVAMCWVAWPWLFRDWAAKFTARPLLFRATALFGVVYGAAVILCAILYW